MIEAVYHVRATCDTVHAGEWPDTLNEGPDRLFTSRLSVHSWQDLHYVTDGVGEGGEIIDANSIRMHARDHEKGQ